MQKYDESRRTQVPRRVRTQNSWPRLEMPSQNQRTDQMKESAGVADPGERIVDRRRYRFSGRGSQGLPERQTSPRLPDGRDRRECFAGNRSPCVSACDHGNSLRHEMCHLPTNRILCDSHRPVMTIRTIEWPSGNGPKRTRSCPVRKLRWAIITPL